MNNFSKTCIVIPSFNPNNKLTHLIEELCVYEWKKIIIIDDGSTQETVRVFHNIVKNFGVTLITHETNKGKGAALKTGFNYIKNQENGSRGIITVDSDGQHLIEDIIKIAQRYMKVMEEWLVSPDPEERHCFILEKPNARYDVDKNGQIKTNEKGEKRIKDGVHIMIPSILTIPMIQYIVRYRMIKNDGLIQKFKDMNITNSIDDIIDICVIEKNNWQMYGSTKPNCEAYKLTKIYSYFKEKIKPINVDKYDNRHLLTLFSIRNKNKKDLTIVNENKIQDINNEYSTLPMTDKIKKQQKPVIRKKKKKSPSRINLNFNDNIGKIKQIITLLDKKRSDNYNDWQNLGWCLHNIDDRLLPLWIDFSKQSSKFKQGECEQVWPYMDNQGLGLGTLYMWAKDDSPTEYEELTKNELRKYIQKSLGCAPFDIGVMMYQMFKDEFVCANIKKKVWYYFNNHRWKQIDEGIELKKRISTIVLNEFTKLRVELGIKQSHLDAESDDFEDVEKKIKKIAGVVKALKTTGFKKNVMEECTELFYVENFENELDVKTNLIGFENGVYDLETGYFRDGISEDYIKYSTKINYSVRKGLRIIIT